MSPCFTVLHLVSPGKIQNNNKSSPTMHAKEIPAATMLLLVNAICFCIVYLPNFAQITSAVQTGKLQIVYLPPSRSLTVENIQKLPSTDTNTKMWATFQTWGRRNDKNARKQVEMQLLYISPTSFVLKWQIAKCALPLNVSLCPPLWHRHCDTHSVSQTLCLQQ